MLPALTACFIAGLVAGAALPYLPLTIGSLLTGAAVLFAYASQSFNVLPHGRRLYASLLLGVLYWTVYSQFIASPSVDLWSEPGPTQVQGRIVRPVEYSPGRAVLFVKPSLVTRYDREFAAPAALLRVTWREFDRSLYEGDEVQLTARFHPPTGLINPGGFNYAEYLRRQGVEAVATVSGPDGILVTRPGLVDPRWMLWNIVDVWRDRIRQSATNSLPDPVRGIFLGIIIGDGGGLSPEVRDLFMTSGTVHILSISGSHLGLIALLSFAVVRRGLVLLPARWLEGLGLFLTPPRLAGVVTGVIVTGYTLLAGSEIATVRSLIMISVLLVAVWLGYRAQLLHSLAAAALVILFADPRSLFDMSFQLSFVSVLAIALVLQMEGEQEAEDRPRQWLRRLWEGVRGATAITGAVTVATLPLVAHYFNQIAWVGLFSNLVVVPFVGLVLVPLGLLSSLWLLLEGGAFLPMAGLQESLLHVLVETTRWTATLPHAEWRVAAPSIPAMAIYFGALALVQWSRQRVWLRLVAAGLVLLSIGWWGWSPSHLGTNRRLHVTFLDVGQGDAIVIRLPEGATILIDGGATFEHLDMGRAVVGPFLWNQGVRRIDYIIGTHPQLDHIGGLAWIIRHFPVAHYWGIGIRREEPFAVKVTEALDATGLREEVAARGQEVLIGDGLCRLSVLHPTQESLLPNGFLPSILSGHALNNRSLVTLLTCRAHTFLFTADVETEVLEVLSNREGPEGVRVLKVPHHGAKSSLNRSWIEHLHPEVAVVSAGRFNPYGHPSPEVIQAYADAGVPLLRTDRQGAVSIAADVASPLWSVHTAIEWTLQPVLPEDSWWKEERKNWQRLFYQWGVSET
jgi:competence protein ComEC